MDTTVRITLFSAQTFSFSLCFLWWSLFFFLSCHSFVARFPTAPGISVPLLLSPLLLLVSSFPWSSGPTHKQSVVTNGTEGQPDGLTSLLLDAQINPVGTSFPCTVCDHPHPASSLLSPPPSFSQLLCPHRVYSPATGTNASIPHCTMGEPMTQLQLSPSCLPWVCSSLISSIHTDL